MTLIRHGKWLQQRGAAVVEFALVFVIFLTLLLAIIEFGRVLFTFDSAAEATRRGTRLAVVSALEVDETPAEGSAILLEMRYILSDLKPGNVSISCTPSRQNCEYVQVSLRDYSVPIFAFWVLLGRYLGLSQAQDAHCKNLVCSIPVPAFATTLPRESLGND